MIREIIRNDITSDICRLGLELNMHHKFCSYTTNTVSQSADIRLSLPAGKKITIYWGDGESTVITGEVITTIYSHTYADIKTYNLTVTGDYNDITYLDFIGDGSYGGDIKYMPIELTHFKCDFQNTFTGNIKYLSNLFYFSVSGNKNTFYGSLKDFPRNLGKFYCLGLNRFSGDIKYIPDGAFYFSCTGLNTISEYTGKTWTTNIIVFKIQPVSPGGLSSAEIDQLLIDLDEDLDWSGGGKIYLLGTNAPRTSASDNAVNNIIAEGGTVICNN